MIPKHLKKVTDQEINHTDTSKISIGRYGILHIRKKVGTTCKQI
jgi:uncharacterized protein (UPF0216 family)